MAVVSNPRTCYLINTGSLGVPVFDRQGKLMGVICQCIKPDKEEGGSISAGTPIHLVLPAADVAKLVPQAKEEMKKAADADKKSGDAGKKDKKSTAAEKKGKKSGDAKKKPDDAGNKSSDKPSDAEKKSSDKP